jgi:hypothetical protein
MLDGEFILARTLLKLDQISLNWMCGSINRDSNVTWNIANTILLQHLQSYWNIDGFIRYMIFNIGKVLINPYRVKDFHRNVMADSKHMTTMCSVILVIVMSLLHIIYELFQFVKPQNDYFWYH